MSDSDQTKIFVTLKSEDRALQEMQKRINKLSLIQIWVMKAAALFNRYLNTLDKLDSEPDSIKKAC